VRAEFKLHGPSPDRSHLKKRILVQYQGGREVYTDGVAVTAIAGIHQYFEDLNRAPNTEIEPKDFFEVASNKKPGNFRAL
jgi:hypothetical protein